MHKIHLCSEEKTYRIEYTKIRFRGLEKRGLNVSLFCLFVIGFLLCFSFVVWNLDACFFGFLPSYYAFGSIELLLGILSKPLP